MKYEKRKEKELFNIRAKSQAIWEVAPRSLFPPWPLSLAVPFRTLPL